MLNLNSFLLSSSHPQVLVDFYQKVIGEPADMSDGGYTGWLVGSGFLTIGPHSEIQGMAKDPARIIFNFETETVKEEFDRIKKLGATVIKEPYDMGGMWIATLADPDGNYFQLLTPWEDKSDVN